MTFGLRLSLVLSLFLNDLFYISSVLIGWLFISLWSLLWFQAGPDMFHISIPREILVVTFSL